jgi:hypothetical protein
MARARLLVGESATGVSPEMIISTIDGKEISRDVAPFAALRWASEWLPMYCADTSGGKGSIHSPARLFASLRGIPHAQRLDVRWQIAAPQFPPACTDKKAREILRSPTWWRHPDFVAWNGVIEYGNKAGIPHVTGRRNQFRVLGFRNTPSRAHPAGYEEIVRSWTSIDAVLRAMPTLPAEARSYFVGATP